MPVATATVKQRLELWSSILRDSISYYIGLRVIFYSEIALIMFCVMDFAFHFTHLVIMLKMSGRNFAYSHVAMARPDSQLNFSFWSEVFLMLLMLYLVESGIRIYYVLKLAYYHNRKVKDGDLCCMTCHSALISAAMTNEVVAPHFLSAICLIVFFIYSNANTAAQTTQLYNDYFRENPFVSQTDLSNRMIESATYQMGSHVIGVLKDCRVNASQLTAEDSVRQLLFTGNLLAVVEQDCAKMALRCHYSRCHLQLSIESVQALINYTVIRALFGHVINMHQYEVYNQQSRLQTRGGTRLIQVYKVRHARAHRKSRPSVMELPRRALMSLVSMGTNMASRFRSSREIRRHQRHAVTPKDVPICHLEDSVEERLLSVDTGSYRTPRREKLLDSSCSEAGEDGESPRSMGQQQEQQLYNRRSAASSKKVNYEYLKVSQLYPGTLEPSNDQQQQIESQTTEANATKTNLTSGDARHPPQEILQQEQQQQQQRQQRQQQRKQEQRRKTNRHRGSKQTLQSTELNSL